MDPAAEMIYSAKISFEIFFFLVLQFLADLELPPPEREEEEVELRSRLHESWGPAPHGGDTTEQAQTTTLPPRRAALGAAPASAPPLPLLQGAAQGDGQREGPSQPSPSSRCCSHPRQ